jgi:hypothetical protein
MWEARVRISDGRARSAAERSRAGALAQVAAKEPMTFARLML